MVKRGMNTMKKDFFKHSYLGPNMNKRGDVETDYPIEFIVAVIIIAIVVIGGIFYVLLPKGMGATEFINRVMGG